MIYVVDDIWTWTERRREGRGEVWRVGVTDLTKTPPTHTHPAPVPASTPPYICVVCGATTIEGVQVAAL